MLTRKIKKYQILLFVSILMFIVSCAEMTFDSFEYNNVIIIKEIADVGYTQCNTIDTLKPTIIELNKTINHLELYSSNRAYKPLDVVAITNLKDIIKPLYNNAKNNEKISLKYCQEKMQTISKESEMIYKTLGQL